mmetsp:Transcript_24238/g.36350  ORF Transcript_24238/g.36350 Transcript_24238/m.36350 type:complete len:585 (-) Transcript_24238:66-1820(-)
MYPISHTVKTVLAIVGVLWSIGLLTMKDSNKARRKLQAGALITNGLCAAWFLWLTIGMPWEAFVVFRYTITVCLEIMWFGIFVLVSMAVGNIDSRKKQVLRGRRGMCSYMTLSQIVISLIVIVGLIQVVAILITDRIIIYDVELVKAGIVCIVGGITLTIRLKKLLTSVLGTREKTRTLLTGVPTYSRAPPQLLTQAFENVSHTESPASPHVKVMAMEKPNIKTPDASATALVVLPSSPRSSRRGSEATAPAIVRVNSRTRRHARSTSRGGFTVSPSASPRSNKPSMNEFAKKQDNKCLTPHSRGPSVQHFEEDKCKQTAKLTTKEEKDSENTKRKESNDMGIIREDFKDARHSIQHHLSSTEDIKSIGSSISRDKDADTIGKDRDTKSPMDMPFNTMRPDLNSRIRPVIKSQRSFVQSKTKEQIRRQSTASAPLTVVHTTPIPAPRQGRNLAEKLKQFRRNQKKAPTEITKANVVVLRGKDNTHPLDDTVDHLKILTISLPFVSNIAGTLMIINGVWNILNDSEKTFSCAYRKRYSATPNTPDDVVLYISAILILYTLIYANVHGFWHWLLPCCFKIKNNSAR